MHVLGTGVLRCLGVARSASSPNTAQALGCSLTPGLRISFGRVTCEARAASVPGLWTLGFLLLRGACVWVWVVVKFGFRLRPATPGWGVGVCVRVCVRSACTLPLLAGVCGVDVCASARVSAAPRHSWLGSWGVCVLVCVLRLYPPLPGWGVRLRCVCLDSSFGCAPPRLAGVLGCVCVCRRALLVPRHSWLGCVVGASVPWLGLRLHPATSGWGVGVCVCLCARSACTPPHLAGVVGCACAGVCALLVDRHSWLGCAVWVCAFGLGFRLRPATHGWVVGLVVCSCACPPCTLPLLAGMCGVGVCVWAGVSAVLRHIWLGCWGEPARVRAPVVPRHSWLRCAVGVCVFWLGFCSHPATIGWGVGVCVFVCLLPPYPATPDRGARRGCVCLGSGFCCLPPLMAGVLGYVCARVRAPHVPRHPWLGCAV